MLIIERSLVEDVIERLKGYQKKGIAMGEGYNQGAIDAYNWILKFSKVRSSEESETK